MSARQTGEPTGGAPQSRPVVVVGGGPVGVTVASLLAAAGVPTLVLEREREVYPLPRAVHVDDEVMRILQSIGVAEQMLPHIRPLAAMQLLDADRRLLAAFPRTLRGPHGYAVANMFHQPAFEQVLRDVATARHGVALRTGWNVEQVEPARSHVRIGARECDTGRSLVVDAEYVLACDGARSPIRDALGISMGGRRFSQQWVVVDTVVPGGLPAFPHAQQVSDPGRPATYVPFGQERFRWEFQVLPGERPEDLTTPPTLARLLSPWVRLERVQVERATVYMFRAVAAERWRAGRVFLLGDAAHQMPPFLGQGLCAGIRDAQNLAWKLALVLTGRAHVGLLQTYEQERASHVAEITRLAVLFGGMMQGGGRGGDTLRRLLSRAALASPGVQNVIERQQLPGLRPGPLVPPGVRGRRGAGGGLLPQPIVGRADGCPVRLDEVLGTGFSLVGFGMDPRRELTSAAQGRWERLGGRCVLVAPPGTAAGMTDPRTFAVTDVTGSLTDWASYHGAWFTVVRPDRYVFGIAGPGRRAARSLDHLVMLAETAVHSGLSRSTREAPSVCGPDARGLPTPPLGTRR